MPSFETCEELRMLLADYSIAYDSSIHLENLGAAAILIQNYAGDDFENSTFKVLTNYGQVFGLELCRNAHKEEIVMMEVLWQAAEIVMQSTLKIRRIGNLWTIKLNRSY